MSGAALALTVFAVASSTTTDRLQEDVASYYSAEETAGGAIAMVGLISIVTSALFVLESDEIYVGAAIPFVSIGAFRMAVGGSAFFSAADELSRAEVAIRRNADRFRAVETKRMKVDALYYDVMLVAEAAAVLIGAGVGVLATRGDEPLVAGIGFGFGGQALLMFIFDLVASWRTAVYVERVAPVTIVPAVSFVTDHTDRRASFGLIGRF